jgi:NAD(P)-dependent dehydrogenase (short-subunit alcohol dehydrogenase family)
MGIRVSTIQPAYTKTAFDTNTLEPDARLDEYQQIRAALKKRMALLIEAGDAPEVVADVVLKAALAAHPKLKYTAGAFACRLKLLRKFAPSSLLDAGIRKNLQLDT